MISCDAFIMIQVLPSVRLVIYTKEISTGLGERSSYNTSQSLRCIRLDAYHPIQNLAKARMSAIQPRALHYCDIEL